MNIVVGLLLIVVSNIKIKTIIIRINRIRNSSEIKCK